MVKYKKLIQTTQLQLRDYRENGKAAMKQRRGKKTPHSVRAKPKQPRSQTKLNSIIKQYLGNSN